MPPHVAVVGGGVAGIAAAVRLAKHDVRVTLLERSNRLGGRAGSFHDRELDEPIDNCQHVALGCCTAYLGLLESLDAADALEWTSGFSYVERSGRTSRLSIPDWPAPLHGLPLLAGARFLTIGDRLAIAAGLARMASQHQSRWSGRSFACWLAAHRQTRSAVRRFWTPIVVSACNARPEACEASAAIKVFREGFLRSHRDAAMGVPVTPLAHLYEALPAVLHSAGGTARTGAAVTGIDRAGVTLRSGERLDADAVVLATPFAATADLLDSSDIDAREVVANLRSLRHSPIVAVHLEYADPVSDLPHAVLLDGAFDWLFFKDGGRRVHAVASAAESLTDHPAERLIDTVHAEIARRFGAAEQPVWARAIKERRATFLAAPGSDRLRPRVDALAPDIWLAGDYTDTGWPATMEGATRSGNAAAEAVIGSLRKRS